MMWRLQAAVLCSIIAICFGCGGNLKGPQGQFTSPNYPDDYPNDANCEWIIDLDDKESAVKLVFSDFELEGRYAEECVDYVRIVDTANGNVIGTYCDDESPGTVYSSTDKLRVEFVTDSTITYRGFKAAYTSVNRTELPSTTAAPTTPGLFPCGGKLTGTSGTVTSPNYPDEYPDDIECTWSIEVPDKDMAISLTFTDFELEGRVIGDCPDFVRISDGLSARVIGEYCGDENPGTVYSSGYKMTILFKTDSTLTYRGFSADYKAINKTQIPPTTTEAPTTTEPPTTTTAPHPCGGYLNESKGAFMSPNYPDEYPDNLNCVWNIELPDAEKAVRLAFSDFELEGRAGGDCVDYVRITDTASGKVIGIYCDRETPGTVYATSNKMKVELITDESLGFRGFRALYDTIDKSAIPTTTPIPTTTDPSTCRTEITADSGFITSPNYPQNYPNEADCSYVMRLETGGKIALEFVDFQLEYDRDCANDYVTIHDGDNSYAKELGKFCGAGVSRIVGSGPVIYLRFRSDVDENNRGFNATFFKGTCENLGGTCGGNCSYGDVDYDCAAGQKCCLPKLLPDRCGERPGGNKEAYIVGGTPAKPNSWPWQISLQSNSGRHYCGAVLFTPEWVVTAAHCVHDESVVNIVLGEHDRMVESGNEVRVKASRILIHPKFINSAPWPNDVALLKLPTPLKPSPYYNVACMPDDEDMPFEPSDTCYITGWGDTKGTGDETILNELLIKPQTNADCRRMWDASSILDSHICVGNGETGSCQGDSGGPLVCKKDKKWVLGGVTSWGVNGCRTRGLPSVYTRISKFLDWIRKNML